MNGEQRVGQQLRGAHPSSRPTAAAHSTAILLLYDWSTTCACASLQRRVAQRALLGQCARHARKSDAFTCRMLHNAGRSRQSHSVRWCACGRAQLIAKLNSTTTTTTTAATTSVCDRISCMCFHYYFECKLNYKSKITKQTNLKGRNRRNSTRLGVQILACRSMQLARSVFRCSLVQQAAR